MNQTEQTRKWPLRLVSVDREELLVGAVLIMVSLFMPLIFNVDNFNVLDSLYRAMRQWEKIDLLAAALQLVALNALRSARKL